MFPKPARISWAARPASEGVTGYRVSVNGVEIGIVTGTQVDYAIPAAGTYTATVSAINASGEGPAGSAVIILQALPGVVTNVSFVTV